MLLKVSGDNVFSAELPEKFKTCPIFGAVCREECRDMPAESGEKGNKRDNSVPDYPRGFLWSLWVVGLKQEPAEVAGAGGADGPPPGSEPHLGCKSVSVRNLLRL